MRKFRWTSVSSITYGFCGRKATLKQELCESLGGRPGLSVPNNSPVNVPNCPSGLCGRKATFEDEEEHTVLGVGQVVNRAAGRESVLYMCVCIHNRTILS